MSLSGLCLFLPASRADYAQLLMVSMNTVRDGLQTGNVWYLAEARIFGFRRQMAASRFASSPSKVSQWRPFSPPIACVSDSQLPTLLHILTLFGRFARTALTFIRCCRGGTLRLTSAAEPGRQTVGTSFFAAPFTAIASEISSFCLTEPPCSIVPLLPLPS